MADEDIKDIRKTVEQVRAVMWALVNAINKQNLLMAENLRVTNQALRAFHKKIREDNGDVAPRPSYQRRRRSGG